MVGSGATFGICLVRSVGRLTSGVDMERLRGREVLFAEIIRVEHNLVDVESGQPGIELRGEALVFRRPRFE